MIGFYADRKGHLIAADVLIKCEVYGGIMTLPVPVLGRADDVYRSAIDFEADYTRRSARVIDSSSAILISSYGIRTHTCQAREIASRARIG